MNRSFTAILSLSLIFVSPGLRAEIDTNSNGVSDLWERQFNGELLFDPSFDPAADLDNDGWTNAQEAAAGTDPKNSTAPGGMLVPQITHTSYVDNGPGNDPTPAAIRIAFPSIAGKRYALLCSPDLGTEPWIPVGDPFTAQGGETVYSLPTTDSGGGEVERMFFRVSVSDIDTDGDGYTDWEESQTGGDPLVPDRDGDGLPDQWEIAHGLDPDDDGSIDPDNGAAGDADGDGVTNIREFRAGTDAADADDFPAEILSVENIVRTSANFDPLDSRYHGHHRYSPWDGAALAEVYIDTALLEPSDIGSELEGMSLPALPATALSASPLRLERATIVLEPAPWVGSSFNINAQVAGGTYRSKRCWVHVPKSGVAREFKFYIVRTHHSDGPEEAGGVTAVVLTVPPDQVYSSDFADLISTVPIAMTGKTSFTNASLETIDISWKAIDNFENVEDHIDPWGPHATKGKRIFPGFKNPDESTLQAKLHLIVKTSPGMDGTKVHLKAFDIDDSTLESFDVDPMTGDPVIDTEGAKGDDNRADYLGTPAKGQFYDISANSGAGGWGSDTVELTLDGQGGASIDFRVGMQPGNNYRIVASLIDDSMIADVQTDDPAAPGYLGPEPEQNGGVPASPPLTVWRRLWVENDSMGAIPKDQFGYKRNDLSWNIAAPRILNSFLNTTGGTTFIISAISDITSFENLENGRIIVQSQTLPVIDTVIFGTGAFGVDVAGDHTNVPVNSGFRLYDDDDFGLAAAPLPNLKLAEEKVDDKEVMKDVFRPAFIEIVSASAYNTPPNLEFLPNAWITSFDDSIFDDNIDIPDSNNLWAVTVVAAYQGELDADLDPQNEDASEGVTPPIGATFSVVWVETIREYNDLFLRSSPADPEKYNKEIRRNIILTASHEIAHHPNYSQGNSHHGEFGLMGEDGYVNGSTFKPQSILRFRKTFKWTQY